MRLNTLSASVLAGLALRVRNDGDTIENLQDKLVQLTDTAKGIQARADAEKRPCTTEENTDIQNCLDAFEDTAAEIERREQIQALEARVSSPGMRRGGADGQLSDKATIKDAATPSSERPQPRTRTPRIEAIDDKGKNGFRSFGEFAKAVLISSAKGA